MDVLGIDFGTSNTVAVLAGPGRQPRVLGIDGSGWIPSCVYIDDDGTLAVGRDAERKARLSPERYEPNPKRRIDDGEILLGVRIVPVVDAIAAVLHRVVDEARRQLNGRSPDRINLTHPAEWGPSRRNVLLAAARAAGLGPAVMLLPEPVAAAAHFWAMPDKQLTPGSSLAVYDLGGGTFDCAVVGSTTQGFLVLAEAGLATVGGVDFDQAVVDHVGRAVSGQDPARWQALMRPRNATDRRAARTLREDIRAAKETLSRYAQTDLSLPAPFEDTLLTRREFEGLIRPVLAQTVELLSGTIARSGLRPDQLGGIYLVGGSSRIPLVATMIGERLGIVPTTLDQPETAVAMGAALLPGSARTQGRTDVGADGPVAATALPGPASAAPTFDARQVANRSPADPPAPTRQLPAVTNGAAPGARRPRRTRLLAVAAVLAVLLVAAVVVALSRSGADPTDIAGRTTGSTALTVPSPASSSSSASRRSATDFSVPTSATSSQPSTSRTSTSRTSTSRTSTSRTSTSRTSTSRTSRSTASCSNANPTTGLTGCMRQVIGDLADLKCSKNPSTIGLDDTALVQLQKLTSGFSTCIDSDRGFATVIFQATDDTNRDALGAAVRTQFTPSRSGSWTAGGRSGRYYVGLTATGISLLEWEDGELPIVTFLGATKGAGTGDMLDYWKSALGATITG